MTTKTDKSNPASRVPSGRLNRFLQLGATAGRMAAGGLAESARRLGKKAQDELPHALLTGQNARLLASRLARLRGAAMKVGQMLSLEGDSSLPPEFAEALSILRSSAHRMPREQVESVLQRELGKDYRQLFSAIDLEAEKAASIGQVHRALAHDGRSLVLKIQYPGVAESIDSDVDNLRSLLGLARLLPGEMDLDVFVAEVKAELHREVDYERELSQLEAYRKALGDFGGVFVPASLPEVSSKRVLTMEHARGDELLDWAKTATQDERDRVGEQLFHLLFHEFFEMGLMQTDPNPANYLYDPEQERLVLLDFGATREVPSDVSELYRRAFEVIAQRDRAGILSVMKDLGVRFRKGSPMEEAIVDIVLMSAEILDDKPFDFGRSDLARALNDKGRRMAEYGKDVTPPPPSYIFFQRKLSGTFLLCKSLGARVNCRTLLRKYGIA